MIWRLNKLVSGIGYKFAWAYSEDSNQTLHLHSLITVFVFNISRALTNWQFAVLNSHFWCWDSYFLKETIFFCIVGLPLFGKEGSGTPVFKFLVRALIRNIGALATLRAPIEGSDQPAQMCRLIWVFDRRTCRLVCLFDLILYVPSTIFQLYRDGSSWVEPVLS